MAGSYPDVPGYRFAYDLDGTVAVVYGLPLNTLSSNEMTSINDDHPALGHVISQGGPGLFCIIFPEPRLITGICLNWGSSPSTHLEYSSDTTTGMDGSWSTALPTYSGINTTIKADLKTNITSLSLSDCTAIRFSYIASGGTNANRHIYNLHLYGSIPSIESPDRLRIVDMTNNSTTSDGGTQTGDDITAQLDFGNIAQRASTTRQFKVVNNSSSHTADNVTVSLDIPTDTNPSLLGQYQVSTDNNAFANMVNIGSLAPGASSNVLYVRIDPANNAQLGPWSARIIAHPVSWS